MPNTTHCIGQILTITWRLFARN